MQDNDEATYARRATDHDRLVRLDGAMLEVRADVAEMKVLLQEQNGILLTLRLWRAEQSGQLKGAATIGGIAGGILAFLATMVAKAMGWL